MFWTFCSYSIFWYENISQAEAGFRNVVILSKADKLEQVRNNVSFKNISV
jgi:hypothetical protein